MVERILLSLEKLLKGLHPSELKRLARTLAEKLGRPFNGANSGTLMADIRAFATDPKTVKTLLAAVAATGLVGGGYELYKAEFAPDSSNSDPDADDESVVQQMYDDLAAHRAAIIGDGSSNAFGVPTEQARQFAARAEALTDSVETCCSMTGLRPAALRQLQCVLLGVKDQEWDEILTRLAARRGASRSY